MLFLVVLSVVYLVRPTVIEVDGGPVRKPLFVAATVVGVVAVGSVAYGVDGVDILLFSPLIFVWRLIWFVPLPAAVSAIGLWRYVHCRPTRQEGRRVEAKTTAA